MTLFGQTLRKERGEKTRHEFAKELDVPYTTYCIWEAGANIPKPMFLTDIADQLGWSDHLRMACMKKLNPEYSELQKKLITHMRFLRLYHEEAALVLGEDGFRMRQWMYRGIPKLDEKKVRDFLEMNEEQAYKILMVKEGTLEENAQ